jgi:hypothetical protein
VRFNVVYHVAALNHWRRVVEDQLGILLRNKDIGSVHVTVAADSPALTAACSEHVEKAMGASGRALPLRISPHPIGEFEHPAMALIDDLAREDDAPILYFHGKGVSYSPPNPLFETWRGYLNQFVAEADGWAQLLLESEYDACGPLKLFDRQHGFTYFAGNFWMAKAGYLRELPPYAEFLRDPGSPYFKPNDRHLAEVAVNRSRRVKALAADNTDLTHESIWPYLQQLHAVEARAPR